VTAKELKAGIDRSSFISDRVRIDLVEAFIFETGANEKREQFLQVNVIVTNRDERRYLSIETPGFFSTNYRWRLKDDVANKVRESHGDRIGELKLLSSLDRIKPEKTANGAILFEPPLPKTEYLVLDLAPQMFEFNERVAFMGAAFLLIPFDSVTTPESRLLAATRAVEQSEQTGHKADDEAAWTLVAQLDRFDQKGAKTLSARYRIVRLERAVSRFEASPSIENRDNLYSLLADAQRSTNSMIVERLASIRKRVPAFSWPVTKNTIGMESKLLPVGTTPTKPARPISNPNPMYPPDAVQQGLEGRVILSVTISFTGKVTKVTVAESCGHESLDQAALGAVRRWRFSPATRDGKPVEWTARLPIRFRL
jgi:periplasmic protein TonB